MILDNFTLSGKVAIVTGCDTGLGQAMAIALAQAGCDIVGVNRKAPEETAACISALGRRFRAIRADLSQQESLQNVVDSAVAEMGRVDILVNNAGTIRREDALAFSEKDWDDVINLNLKSLFSSPRPWLNSLLRRARAGKSLISPRCSHSRAASACPLTPRPKAACWGSRVCWPMNGRHTASMLTPSRQATWRPTTLSNCEMTSSAARRSSTGYLPGAGEFRKTCRDRWYF